jgi:multicomponent Na+:H+ antiporter subunit E
MLFFLVLFASLSAFWLLLSGFWDNPLLLALGLVSVMLASWLGVRAEPAGAGFNLGMLWRLPVYWGWLMVEIIKANLDVVKRIWQPALYPISPTLANLDLSQKTALGRAIYAQSITLTPGTVAIEVVGGKVLVHALTDAGVADLERGEMDRRVTRVERGRP